MKGKMMGERIELETDWAVIELPVETIGVKMEIMAYHDGEIVIVNNRMGLKDIRTAFDKAEEDVFFLTEKGKEYADRYLV